MSPQPPKVTLPPKNMQFPFMVIGAAIAMVVVLAVMFSLKRYADQLRAKVPFLEKPGKFVTDIVKSEDTHDVAIGSVKGTFLKGLKERNWEMAASGMTDDFRGRFPSVNEGKEVPDAAIGIWQYSYEGLAELDRKGFLKVMESQIGSWSSVERWVWRSYEFLLDPGGKKAFVSAHFQLAGRTTDGGRADIQAVIQAQVVTADGKTWRVSQLGLVEGWRAEAGFQAFEDITDVTGLHFNVSEERQKVLRGLIDDRGIVTLGGLTVADFNRDGFPDVLASVVNNDAVLFTNDGRGGFSPGVSPAGGPDECGYVWLYVDLDNDGVEELVSSQVLSYEGGKAHGAVYRRDGDGWRLQKDALVWDIGPGDRDLSIQGIVPCDIDRDGNLDLFLCVYSNRNSKGSNYNRIAAYDGADNYLFMNHGGLKFTEESDRRGISGTQYTYVAKFWDFDFDGDLDLFEGNDFGPNHLWLNDGKAHFTDAKDHIFDAESNYTMGVSIADWDNTGAWSMYISNMYSHAGNRIVPLISGVSERMKSLAKVIAQGNQLYECEPQSKTWRETGIERGVNWADWSWGCVFWDPDNDTDKDIFVPNGFTTNQDPKTPDY